MEIEISGRAVFGFKPTVTLLQSLETCAILHYDLTCQTQAQKGGLIQRAIQSLGFIGADGAWETWSFRELDLILKVCENPPPVLEANQKALLADFVRLASAALSEANRLSPTWKALVKSTNGTWK